MDYEVGIQQEAQHAAAQTAGAEMTQALAVQQRISQDATDSRATLNAASREAGNRMNNAIEDLRDGPAEELADMAEDWLSDAQESLDAAQDAANNFFRKVDEQVDTASDGNQQQLGVLADQAAQAVRDFAVQIDQQTQDLSDAVSQTLDEGNTDGLKETLRQAAEDTSALRDQFEQTMQQLNEQLKSAHIDVERADQLDASQQASQNNTTSQLDLNAIASEALDRIENGTFRTGELLELQPHRAASQARDEMEVTGKTHQSTHAGPQKSLESLDQYNPNDMLTRIMERDKHSEMDAGWKRQFQERAAEGEKDLSVQDLYETVSRSIDAAQKLTEQEKESHKAHLSDELFHQLGLKPDDRVRMPYSKS